ncbi:GAF domain-containing protein [Paraglaciecola aquimarina]|uniref:GAF domain-containing protein n=1 Tax=Paraglaciecola aquimarina TaxID=1235557 RepID=A0ABU3SZ35_9ALTE|nr:GAF domain-containing protein [Paraglaciecola aquimarina]MDU0355182.1 GAF domain-containing protein [Paraglaciecola aquimarina]
MTNTKIQHYQELADQVQALIAGESNMIANMANISAVLYWGLKNVNWAGFYVLQEQQLVLGPFQGKPACIRIPLGKGVCGTAAADSQVQMIDDVHQFAGHIACDAQSNAEIVLPVYQSGKVIAVLDIDSTVIARFDEDDKQGLQKIVDIFQQSLQLGVKN